MARVKHANGGAVVSVADDKVDRLLRSGFTAVEDKPKATTAKSTAKKPARRSVKKS